MNVFRICLFIFLFQISAYLILVSGVPEFRAGVISTDVKTQIDSELNKDFQTRHVKNNGWWFVEMDSVGAGVEMFTVILGGIATGMYSIVIFVFGTSLISRAIAVCLQFVVWYFYVIVVMRVLFKFEETTDT